MRPRRALLAIMIAAASAFSAGCRRSSPGPDDANLFVSGRIEGDEVDLAFKIGGRVETIVVREGDNVRKGDLLARLSSEQEMARLREAQARAAGARRRLEQAAKAIPTLEQRLAANRLVEAQARQDAPGRVAQAEAQVSALKSELARVMADEEQVRNDAERYARLAARGAVSRQMAEQYASRRLAAQAAVEAVLKQIAAAEAAVTTARAALQNPEIRQAESGTLVRQMEEARAAVAFAEAEVAAAEAGRQRVEADVAELELRAPVDATVITRAAEPGRVVAPGATVMTLVDLGRLYLRGYIPEGRIGLVKVAQQAEVFLDAEPQKPIPATVMRIDPEGMFTPENTYFQEDRVRQVFGVKLLLQGEPGKAKPGMPADGLIHIGGPDKQG